MLSKSWVSYFLPWLPRDKGKVGPLKECLFGDRGGGGSKAVFNRLKFQKKSCSLCWTKARCELWLLLSKWFLHGDAISFKTWISFTVWISKLIVFEQSWRHILKRWVSISNGQMADGSRGQWTMPTRLDYPKNAKTSAWRMFQAASLDIEIVNNHCLHPKSSFTI